MHESKNYIQFNIAGEVFEIRGGPYFDIPPGFFGVKMAKEIQRPYDVSIPTVDYSVPFKADLRRGLVKTYRAALRGRAIYVGCWGGIGRTGIFLALLARLAGEADPIGYVREYYNIAAVETEDQEEYVRDFPVHLLKAQFAWERAKYKTSHIFSGR